MRARLAVAAAVLATALAGVGGLAAVRLGEAPDGTVVGAVDGAGGVQVGGLGEADLRARVEELAAERTTGTLTVRVADVEAELPRDLVTVDVEATVEQALDLSDDPLALLLGRGRSVPLALTVDESRLDRRLSALAERADRVPTPGGIDVQGLTVATRHPVAGRALDREQAAEQVADALEQDRRGPLVLPVDSVEPPTTRAQVEAVATAARAALGGPYVLGLGAVTLRLTPEQVAPLLSSELVDGVPTLQVDTAALRAVVAAHAEAIDTAPRSARFSVAGRAPLVEDKGDLTWTPRPASVAVVPGASGRALDVDAATARLAQLVLAADRTPRPLPVTPVLPPLTTEQAQAAGVRQLLGTFTTRFVPGQPRATNIRRIAEIVDGTYVPAGEVLSLNEAAGRRTRARGFVADGAIVDGELTDEVGGGVSQFATTLFNAAFFAGLPILEHKPHSFYIPRYPPGRESTVYYGAIDVKVRNDTAHGLLVRTRSTPGSVTVELYGDNGGRRVTSTSGPRRPRADGGFRIDVTRTTTGGDGQGGRRVFRTSYDPVPPE